MPLRFFVYPFVPYVVKKDLTTKDHKGRLKGTQWEEILFISY